MLANWSFVKLFSMCTKESTRFYWLGKRRNCCNKQYGSLKNNAFDSFSYNSSEELAFLKRAVQVSGAALLQMVIQGHSIMLLFRPLEHCPHLCAWSWHHLSQTMGRGKGTRRRQELEEAQPSPEGSDPAVALPGLLTFYWQELSHMATPICQGGREMDSSHMPRKNGRTDFGEQLAISTKLVLCKEH